MFTLSQVQRLHDAITSAGVAITGVDTNGKVAPANLQAAAQPTIDAFDTSQAAQNTWADSKEPLLQTLRDQAQAAMDDIDTYLAIADSATNVQVRAEVKAIDQRQKKIIQALKRLIQRDWR